MLSLTLRMPRLLPSPLNPPPLLPKFVFTFSMGPLKGLRFRFAKMRPGDGGAMLLNAAPPSLSSLSGARTTRMFVGKELPVGVAGRTLTEEWGDLVRVWCAWLETETAGETREAEEVEEAFECVWWWCGMDRMLEMELLVLFRPRRPPEERR